MTWGSCCPSFLRCFSTTVSSSVRIDIFYAGLWIVGTLNMCWLLATLLSTVFQCNPVNKAYDTTIEGTLSTASALLTPMIDLT